MPAIRRGMDEMLGWIATIGPSCLLRDLREHAKNNKMGPTTLNNLLKEAEELGKIERRAELINSKWKVVIDLKDENISEERRKLENKMSQDQREEELIASLVDTVKDNVLWDLSQYLLNEEERENINKSMMKPGSYAIHLWLIYNDIVKGEYSLRKVIEEITKATGNKLQVDEEKLKEAEEKLNQIK